MNAEFYTLDIRRMFARNATDSCETTAAGIWLIRDEWNLIASQLEQLANQLHTPIEEVIDEQISNSECYIINDMGGISLKRTATPTTNIDVDMTKLYNKN